MGKDCCASTPNELKILLNQIKREIDSLTKTTEAKLLLHDGKIAELCLYLKTNLSNTIRELLDSMSLSGELDSIITDTLLGIVNQKIFYCSSVDNFKCNYFKAGDVVKTLGYHTPNDGGGATYRIRPEKGDDIVDNGLIHKLEGLLVAEMIIEDEKVNVKQFGAIGDGVTDDTQAIQNALNVAKNVFLNKGKYLVTKTLNMKANTKLHGVNEKDTEILVNEKLENSYVINYLEDYSYNDSKGEISNLTIGSVDKYLNYSKGIYLNSGLTISHVDFRRLKVAIKKNTSYIDQIIIDRCNFYYCGGSTSDYVIDVRGNNDGLIINHIHMVDNYSKQNFNKYRGIGITTNNGGSINNSIINVPVYIATSKGFSINNSHFEGSQNSEFYGNLSQIEIFKSDVELNNLYIQKCIDRANIIISSEETDAKNNPFVTLNNCSIVYPSYYLELYEFNELYDIEKDVFTTLKISNSFATTDFSAVWTQTNSKVGLRIKGVDEFNKHSSYYSIHSIIGANNEIKSMLPPIKENSGFYNRPIFQYSSQNKYVPWFEGGFNESTIYYAGVYVFDETRKLALFKTTSANELSLKVTTKSESEGNGVTLRVDPSKIADGLGLTLFVYRGNGSKQYNRLTKVPSSSAMFLYDMGTNINGVETNNRDVGDIDTFNYVKKCELIGDNVIFYADALPTVGTFKKYDRCINTNVKSGATKSWIYDGASWIAEGTY